MDKTRTETVYVRGGLSTVLPCPQPNSSLSTVSESSTSSSANLNRLTNFSTSTQNPNILVSVHTQNSSDTEVNSPNILDYDIVQVNETNNDPNQSATSSYNTDCLQVQLNTRSGKKFGSSVPIPGPRPWIRKPFSIDQGSELDKTKTCFTHRDVLLHYIFLKKGSHKSSHIKAETVARIAVKDVLNALGSKIQKKLLKSLVKSILKYSKQLQKLKATYKINQVKITNFLERLMQIPICIEHDLSTVRETENLTNNENSETDNEAVIDNMIDDEDDDSSSSLPPPATKIRGTELKVPATFRIGKTGRNYTKVDRLSKLAVRMNDGAIKVALYANAILQDVGVITEESKQLVFDPKKVMLLSFILIWILIQKELMNIWLQ